MLYITVALSAEARPLIDTFKLTRTYALPYTLFENSDIKLLVTGVGLQNAIMATSAFLGHFSPNEDDLLLNIGICAAPQSFEIGEAFLVHKLTCKVPYESKNQVYYPDILFEHPLKESDLLSVDESMDIAQELPVDMEAYGVYKAASRFLNTHQLLFFKVVSDHFEPLHVSKESATSLIQNSMNALQNILHSAKYVTKKDSLFSQEEQESIDAIANYFTKSQASAFYDACCYYKLHHKKPLDLKTPSQEKLSKKERSIQFESLVKTLTL